DYGPAARRATRQLHSTAAQYEDATRRLTFDEEYGALWKNRGVLKRFKVLEYIRREITKEVVAPKLAFGAVLYHLESIGRAHNSSRQMHRLLRQPLVAGNPGHQRCGSQNPVTCGQKQ